MGLVEIASFLGDVVTVLGLPFAIFLFWDQDRKARHNEDAAIYESLSSSYDAFLKLVLENSDLRLWTKEASKSLTDEQEERLIVLLELLVALFERAYILIYSTRMTATETRRWATWENHMREWCGREDFISRLPQLLRGDDPPFMAYLSQLADEVARSEQAKT